MKPVTLFTPEIKACPMVVSLPHSGTWIPDDVQALYTDWHLKTLRNTDWHLDKLFDFMPDLGMTVVQANFSRYVIDVNRALSEPLFGPYQGSAIYENNTWGEPIYKKRPDPATFQKRVCLYYEPFHACLEAQIERLIKQFGYVYLLDLHSFMGPIHHDACLGNANGEIRSEKLLPVFYEHLSRHKLDTVINKVFSGGHIIKKYGRLPYCEALQLELRYTLYLDPDELDKDMIPSWDRAQFLAGKARLKTIFEDIAGCHALWHNL